MDLQNSMSEMKAAKADLDAWKPEVNSRVADLETIVHTLGDRVELLFTKGTPTKAAPQDPSTSIHLTDAKTEKPGSAHLESTSPGATSGSIGHDDDNPHRSAGFGVVYTTLNPPPIIGAQNTHHLTPITFGLNDAAICDCGIYVVPVHHASLPYQNFPKFDGTNPHYWVKQCETYFDVYAVETLWVKLASMNLTGSASLWFQTLQTPIEKLTWDSFVQYACNRFDKDEHNLLSRQFFHIRQTSSVAEYVDIVHQLLAHDPHITPSFITNRFVDGLKKDIRAAVLVHRPHDLDTATALAFLQEEALQDPLTRKADLGIYSKKLNSDQSKTSSFTRPTDDKKNFDPGKVKTSDDKVIALKNFRRSKGLCFKCGEKWNPPT